MRFIRVYLSPLLLILFFMASAQAAQLPDFKSLVKSASPAVVNISTVQRTKENGLNPFSQFRGPNGEEIPEIFRHFFQLPEMDQQPRRKAPQSLGSGFIISKDGYILTNHHVVEGAEQVIVRLSDRSEVEAQVVGSDERADIALLKIEGQNLPTVKLGNSGELEVGEWVLAIGSPFGFDYSVTAGIVSAKGRALASETYVPFIQTDVAINPGNSGGPLFNLSGEVVGVNSQIYTRSGGFMGLSFAIPIDVAMNVADQLKAKGYVTRGWLGVIIQEVNKDLAESFGLDKPAGALVTKVLPQSPAGAAGLREGDIILKFNDQPIVMSSDLPHQVGRIKPGAKVKVSVMRGGQRNTIQVTIGELPDEKQVARDDNHKKEKAGANRLNLVVSELDEGRKHKWNLSGGVVVQRVLPGAGADAGLMAGDVITMLNGESISSVSDLERVASELPVSRAVPMRIVRRGSPMFIPLKLLP
ncbi:MAG: DegQ family serine endoprotease [Pontibacterium sp.]